MKWAARTGKTPTPATRDILRVAADAVNCGADPWTAADAPVGLSQPLRD